MNLKDLMKQRRLERKQKEKTLALTSADWVKLVDTQVLSQTVAQIQTEHPGFVRFIETQLGIKAQFCTKDVIWKFPVQFTAQICTIYKEFNF